MSDVMLRYAEECDKKILLDWKNDPDTKKASINTGDISEAQHDEWFERTQNNPNQHLFIGFEFGGVRVGTVRFDENVTEDFVEASITVAPKLRGIGYGKKLLSRGCSHFFNNYRYDFIKATIKKDNLRSQKLFEKVGFERSGEKDTNLIYRLRRGGLRE